jgi:hypothetical protein
VGAALTTSTPERRLLRQSKKIVAIRKMAHAVVKRLVLVCTIDPGQCLRQKEHGQRIKRPSGEQFPTAFVNG